MVWKLCSPGEGDSVAAGKDAAALPCAAMADVRELPRPGRGVGELGARVVPAHEALAVLVTLPLLLLQGVVARRHGLQQPLLGGKQKTGVKAGQFRHFDTRMTCFPSGHRNLTCWNSFPRRCRKENCHAVTHAFNGPHGWLLCTHHPAAIADMCIRAAESLFPHNLPQPLQLILTRGA